MSGQNSLGDMLLMLHKNTSQCRILIVPEEGWFSQPKYSTPSKKTFYTVSVSAFIFFMKNLAYIFQFRCL